MEIIKLNVTQSVAQQIAKTQPGRLFSYQELADYAEHSHAVIKAVSRYTKKWGLVKVKKGLFYRSEKGRFGLMVPKMDEVLHYFTTSKNRTVGYVTGPALYYQWGLTTQVPAEVNIATSTQKKEKINLSGLRVKTTPSLHTVTKRNKSLLQFLDVMKNIDRIPDSKATDVANKLALVLKKYSSEEVVELESIAIQSYSERTKALLGAFFEVYFSRYSEKLYRSLNPTSKYIFSYAEQWNNAATRWRLTKA